jgi:hypothetical protein
MGAPRPAPGAGLARLPFDAHLRARWAEGCRNATALWRELRGLGFAGGRSIVRAHVASWRAAASEGERPRVARAPCTVRTAVLLLRPTDELDDEDEEDAALAALCRRCPEAGVAYAWRGRRPSAKGSVRWSRRTDCTRTWPGGNRLRLERARPVFA